MPNKPKTAPTDIAVADPGGPWGPRPPLSPIFEAPDFIQRPKLHLCTLKYFQKIFALLRSAYHSNSQLTYFDQKVTKKF